MEEKDWGKNIFFPGGRKCSTVTASFSTSSAISSSARQSVAKQYNRSKDIYFPRKQSIKVIKLIQKSKCIFSNNKTDQKIYIVQCAKNQKICLLMLSFCQIYQNWTKRIMIKQPNESWCAGRCHHKWRFKCGKGDAITIGQRYLRNKNQSPIVLMEKLQKVISRCDICRLWKSLFPSLTAAS